MRPAPYQTVYRGGPQGGKGQTAQKTGAEIGSLPPLQRVEVLDTLRGGRVFGLRRTFLRRKGL